MLEVHCHVYYLTTGQQLTATGNTPLKSQHAAESNKNIFLRRCGKRGVRNCKPLHYHRLGGKKKKAWRHSDGQSSPPKHLQERFNVRDALPDSLSVIPPAWPGSYSNRALTSLPTKPCCLVWHLALKHPMPLQSESPELISICCLCWNFNVPSNPGCFFSMLVYHYLYVFVGADANMQKFPLELCQQFTHRRDLDPVLGITPDHLCCAGAQPGCFGPFPPGILERFLLQMHLLGEGPGSLR